MTFAARSASMTCGGRGLPLLAEAIFSRRAGSPSFTCAFSRPAATPGSRATSWCSRCVPSLAHRTPSALRHFVLEFTGEGYVIIEGPADQTRQSVFGVCGGLAHVRHQFVAERLIRLEPGEGSEAQVEEIIALKGSPPQLIMTVDGETRRLLRCWC